VDPTEPGSAEPLPIIECGDPILRRVAAPLEPSDLRSDHIQRLMASMRATMEAVPGVGLAAPQVGVSIQLAVVEDGPDRWGRLTEAERAARERTELPFLVLVNPRLRPVDEADRVSFYEGCLSVPGLTGVVPRFRRVQVQALDALGNPFERVFSGWAARILQHEVDHLAGRLYLDRVEPRSLSTVDNYSRHWAGRPLQEARVALGFSLD
jgi:peptide deformylase